MQDTPTQKDSQTLPVASSASATWISVDEFIKLSGLEEARVLELIESGAIVSKKEGENVMIDASSGTSALIKRVENNLVNADMHGKELSPVFVEKTIATILSLHDKVIASKDETISAFKNENAFLKDALVSMQEVYDDDKKTMEVLRSELQSAREEVEFMKRKYRLMWGKVSNMAEGSK
ncbi:hypothetical protein B9T66_06350 [Helicobacter sp. TUL]|uniref:DUF3972 domain-containing protein n=1 Tax=Helicobacter sp. TUL TaxID=1848928 RepID=UPI000BAB8F52|nr:DUF3972 domain-containing protein [Helicobacter sp. TUL]PAU99673.1 hypothetical protein B9T66_06350 [Helicobacter sp. TUL]